MQAAQLLMGEQYLQSQNKVNTEFHNRRWWQMQEKKLVGVEAGSMATPCLSVCSSVTQRGSQNQKKKNKRQQRGETCGSNYKQEQLKERMVGGLVSCLGSDQTPV